MPGWDSPANAPLAQLVESIRLISERSPVQARQGARFTLTGAYSIRKSFTIATQVSVREDMRPFFRILKTTIYMGHGITGRIKEISKAVVKQVMNTLRMAFMAILVVAAILALSYWFEDPLKRAVFLLGGASVILYVIIKILAVKSYGDEE